MNTKTLERMKRCVHHHVSGMLWNWLCTSKSKTTFYDWRSYIWSLNYKSQGVWSDSKGCIICYITWGLSCFFRLNCALKSQGVKGKRHPYCCSRCKFFWFVDHKDPPFDLVVSFFWHQAHQFNFQQFSLLPVVFLTVLAIVGGRRPISALEGTAWETLLQFLILYKTYIQETVLMS